MYTCLTAVIQVTMTNGITLVIGFLGDDGAINLKIELRRINKALKNY